MRLFSLLELAVYFALVPLVYKVIIAIDFSKFFKKYHVTEIRMFYFIVIVVITKILGDTVIMIIDYFRQFAYVV